LIGPIIREYRKQKGFTLTRLAEEAGIAKSYLSNLERDKQANPSLQVISKISNILDIGIEEFSYNSNKRLDEDWIELIEEAIEHGMTKDDFRMYIEYLSYKQWTTYKESLFSKKRTKGI
jgi:XRE family transcriptional regulator of biofilm formation